MEGPMASDAAAAARGEALAQAQCGAWHALGLTGASTFAGAPAFRNMRFDYNAISYDRRVGQLHGAHTHMPPSDLDPSGLADVGAYVRSLRRVGKH